MSQRILLAAASSLALAACATGPNYVAAPVPSTAAGPFLSARDPKLVTVAPTDEHWWRLFQDPVLDRLVADALAANTDIRVAVARLARARASLREVRGAREPQVGVGGSSQYGRPSSRGAVGERDLQLGAGLEVAYEVDLFGRVSRNVEAARGDVAASAADADAVRVAVVAETARAYADATSAAERIAVAERIVALLDQSLKLTERRRSVGLATGLDTARIAALRDQRRAEVPTLAAQRQVALFRLATLTGRTPAELPPEAAVRGETLRLDRPIPVGDGAALLARRPDVRAAERRLASATARIGVATADLYPRITFGGSIAAGGNGLSSLISNPLAWLVGPLINWTANRSAARARVAGAEADSQAALATFDGTVLTALQETETALSNYARSLERRSALKDASDQAEVAARITRARQREGQIDSLELLDAERTAADAAATLSEADARIAEAQVDLFRALGGGWQPPPISAAAGKRSR
jgi:NodT family efflux transporter outer membrane factor (OMF) lipoprotein